MEFLGSHLLTLILFFPVLAALVVLLPAQGKSESHSLDSLWSQLGAICLTVSFGYSSNQGSPVSSSRNNIPGMPLSTQLSMLVWMGFR